MTNSAAGSGFEIFRKNETKLLGIFNNLENIMRVNPSNSGLTLNAINSLMDFVNRDMAEEEEALSCARHPKALVHKKEHDCLKSTVNYYFSLMSFGNLRQAMEVRDFLAKWMRMHSSLTREFESR